MEKWTLKGHGRLDMASETSSDSIFGKMAMDQGLCTDTELKKAIEHWKASSADKPTTLEHLLIDLGYITSSQANRLKMTVRESKAAVHQIPGYQILGKLGAGAMAVVYKAKQISLDRVVAIKILPKRFTENPEYVERFYKEGQAAGKLNHPNIVQAVDVGEAGGYHYFVMECVNGKTIYDDLSKNGAMKERDALIIAIQVAKALAHAHKQGLIHRDVKPKNIMINEDNVVKLADMGLARATSDVELAEAEKGKAYGTPYYIAPEQIRGEVDIDGRADIYGLGATLYHMVTGRVPFMADDPSDVMRKHLKADLIPPDHINTALSAGISEVIEVTMAKDKNDRYGNCDELIEDLEAVLNGQAPYRARTKFDVSALSELSDGDAIDGDYDEYPHIDSETKYKIVAVVLGAALAVSILAIVVILLT